MSSLPKSIQQQIEDAQRHFEPVENPEETAPAPDAPVAPETDAQPAAPESNADDDKRSPADEPPRSESYWEHRFNVINGKYAKEVPALRDEIKRLTTQLEEKDRQLAERTTAPTNNPGGLTDEQIQAGKDEFGEDFVSFVQQMIDSKAAPANASSKVDELESKLRQLEERDQQKSQASFWAVLPELVPDWKDVNADPAFHTFLAQFDPQTGERRQDALTAAQQALDADEVAKIFNAFKNSRPAPQQPQIPEDQIDPQVSRTNAQAPQGAKIWTGAEIKQFYQDKSQGKLSADEGERLEADIFLAQKEGRIR
ncbi:hypothetical protein [Marinobacter sp. MDS2]|uniref:hypothetical protein n=1 Tax=Marinobacter sp. MDS2 TaxID=3065961 RepID=UPI00273B6B33|nr:hypothetical protein [Marinobacter sp. MDS2]MDP4546490.1 hypothetical protein [Marinobacter sp. MDS2]